MVRLCVTFISIMLLACNAFADSDPVTSEYLKTVGGGTALESKDGIVLPTSGLLLPQLSRYQRAQSL